MLVIICVYFEKNKRNYKSDQLFFFFRSAFKVIMESCLLDMYVHAQAQKMAHNTI